MAANADFRYNSEDFTTAINNYQNVQKQFQDIKDILTECIDSLRDGWQTSAGDAFFADFDDDLSPALDKYINFLSYLIEALQSAQREYDTVIQQAENIRY